MNTVRNANDVKEKVINKIEALRSKQKQEAFACLGNNKARLFEIIERYVRTRRFFLFYTLPVVRFPSHQYRRDGDLGLWALEWECEELIFQFVHDGEMWNTICVYEHKSGANRENLEKLKIILERAFPFYTILVHDGHAVI